MAQTQGRKVNDSTSGGTSAQVTYMKLKNYFDFQIITEVLKRERKRRSQRADPSN